MSRPMRWVGVAVPAHNEAELLPDCLRALRLACGHAEARLSVQVDLLVVLDGCTDGSAAATRSVATLEINARNVGAARRAGFDALLAHRPAHLNDAECWLATSDADSTVPENWLTTMLGYAIAGWHAVAGTVAVADWAAWGDDADRVREAWVQGYTAVENHPHVHGANLGVRADSYRSVGGIPAVSLSEDEALIAALETTGLRIRRTADLAVMTSSRRIARVEGGFSDFLNELTA